MRVKIQLVVCTEDGQEETVSDMVTLEKNCQRIEHLCLTLAEAKQLLKTIQQRLLERQVNAFLAAHSYCDHCGGALNVKGYYTRTFRTLFGTCKLPKSVHTRLIQWTSPKNGPELGLHNSRVPMSCGSI